MCRGDDVHGRDARAEVPAVERAENPQMGTYQHGGRGAGGRSGGRVDL